MRKYTEAQKKAVQKYRSKYKFLNLRLDADEYDLIKNEAASKGCSLNSYVLKIVRERK